MIDLSIPDLCTLTYFVNKPEVTDTLGWQESSEGTKNCITEEGPPQTMGAK